MIWKPNPKQELALSCPYPEIGMGGARGGGKTEAGIAWLIQEPYFSHPQYRALVIRKNWEDLKDWLDRAKEFYDPLGAAYGDGDFRLSKGGRISTGHFKDDKSFQKYVGQQYHRILVEELNLIPREENYVKLMGSLRTAVPDLQPQIMSTFNPSDEGFYWIKQRWQLKGIPRAPVVVKDAKTGLMRAFVPSRLDDNPALAKDPTYRSFLDGLPDGLREAWRDGSWDEPEIAGAYYTLEMHQADREGRLKLCPLDKTLLVHTVWDLGVSEGNAMAIGFFQRIQNQTRLVYYYENENLGLNHYAARLQEWQRLNGISYGKHFAPFDIKNRERSSGITTKDLARKMGINFQDVPKVDPGTGIQKLRLMFPRLWISGPYCEQAISAMRNYKRVWDERLLKYKDEPLHDWSSNCADMMRYAAIVEEEMTNAGERPHWKQPPPTEPFSPLVAAPEERQRGFDDEGFGDVMGSSRGFRPHRREEKTG